MTTTSSTNAIQEMDGVTSTKFEKNLARRVNRTTTRNRHQRDGAAMLAQLKTLLGNINKRMRQNPTNIALAETKADIADAINELNEKRAEKALTQKNIRDAAKFAFFASKGVRPVKQKIRIAI